MEEKHASAALLLMEYILLNMDKYSVEGIFHMQATNDWFPTPVIGQLAPTELALALAELDEDEEVEEEREHVVLESMLVGTPKRFSAQSAKGVHGLKLPWTPLDRLWLHTGHVFGYIPPVSTATSSIPVLPLSAISPDLSLKGNRITIALDHLRVMQYPGRGTHNVLLHFYAQNQVPEMVEELHYNALYRVRQGEHAAIRGYPLFVGLSVGQVGVRVRCRSINVSNASDEEFLSFLDSELVKKGLLLATVAQPAIAQFSHIALGLAKTVATRHRNVAVQDFDLGLDFGRIATGIRLAEGSYVAVQIPESDLTTWSWQNWMYSHDSGQIVTRENTLTLPYNYLVFSISRYSPTT